MKQLILASACVFLFISVDAVQAKSNTDRTIDLGLEQYRNSDRDRTADLVEQEVGQLSPDISEVRPLGIDLKYRPGIAGKPLVVDDTARAWGDFGVPFTSARVSHFDTRTIGSSSLAYLSSTYPYSAIGKLTYMNGMYSGYCTASLIRKSIIVTAAHCIQRFGGGNSIYTKFKFIPAAYENTKPFGEWPVIYIVWPGSWSYGTDLNDNGIAFENDLAILVIGKQNNSFIGNKTGSLKYSHNLYSFIKSPLTGDLWISALSTFGYSGLLDQGKIMQRVDGPSYIAAFGDILQMYQGSDSTTGSSGGPWIANFGYQSPKYSSGAGNGNEAVRNVVMGVTSWGAGGGNSPKNNFSSVFGQNSHYPESDYGGYGAGNIGALMYTTCSSMPTGSTRTFKQLGYCD